MTTTDLAVRAKREHEIVNSPEGQALQEAICKAVQAYSEFLASQHRRLCC